MTVKVTISLSDELAEFADKLAAESGLPRSQIIAQMIDDRRAAALYEELAQAYRELAEENLQFAKDAFPLAAEIWDEYDWDFEEEDDKSGGEPAQQRARRK